MKVIVFDMDDTLYDEFNYVKSGFNAVANFLSSEVDVCSDDIYNWMWNRLKTHGRGKIFDDLLFAHKVYSRALANRCLSVYRLHKPNMELPIESIRIIKKLEKHSCYIVTDGNRIVQSNKVKALGLDKKMVHCYITHRYGRKHSKPSPYCFLQIAKRENINPSEIVYVGDNSRKDFVGIKPFGFRTIRIMTGQHKNVEMTEEYEAEVRINSIGELPYALKKIWNDFEV